MATGPELVIRVPRIVSYEAALFQYIDDGDLCGIKRLFEHGLSSPFDMDPTGLTGLAVSEAANVHVLGQLQVTHTALSQIRI